ncbi:MAG: D-alanyl-D-alanine carboxypeptidase family protein [Pseudomonadota bacterium]
MARVSHRVVGVFMCALVLAVGLLAQSAAAAPYAGIVMDMRSGDVYYARSADRRQHPASLTKMMTLYMTFEALQRGQITLDQRVRVSRHAARQPASKLYLRRGQRVRIRDLIRATAIKSANDAAMVLAETVGGSQKRFGQLMTQKARELGMKNSTFKNPHGLTQKGHLSTARDMAILARHLFYDFPQYYNVFGKKTHMAAGKRIRTTNRLLATYRGAEGMKTGYTRAAGYNLVSVAKRGNERVIAVVMGGKSTRTRNAQSAKLLDLGFRKAPTRVAVKKPSKRSRGKSVLVARAPLPPLRPGMRATGVAAIAEALGPAQAVAAIPSSSSAMAPLYAEMPRARSDHDVAWQLALGNFKRETDALALIAALTLAEHKALKGADMKITSAKARGATRYRVEVKGRVPMPPARACAQLADIESNCLKMKF